MLKTATCKVCKQLKCVTCVKVSLPQSSSIQKKTCILKPKKSKSIGCHYSLQLQLWKSLTIKHSLLIAVIQIHRRHLIILQKDFQNIISKYVKLIFRIFILPAFGNAHCFSLVIYPPTNCKIPVSDKHHARIIPVKRIRASLTSPEIAQLLRERVCALNVHQWLSPQTKS